MIPSKPIMTRMKLEIAFGYEIESKQLSKLQCFNLKINVFHFQ